MPDTCSLVTNVVFNWKIGKVENKIPGVSG